MKNSSWYHSYHNMKSRCYCLTNKDYPRYGGRGIIVCDEWKQNPKQFYADMGDKPDGMTLDRINVNGNYEPSNCRWATAKEQARNRANNLLVELNGVFMCIAEASEITGIKKETIKSRFSKKQNNLFSIPLPRGKNRDKKAKVITPNGDNIFASNIKKFCLENNLDHSSMTKVLRGIKKSHKGFSGHYLEVA